MKAKFICILLLLPAFIFGQISQEEQNLQKYWRFRERLKNFVVPGDGPGCSLISPGREIEGVYPGYSTLSYNGATIVSQGQLNYPDETQHLGIYIGMLAAEYGVLIEHSEFAKAQKTLTELAYALETFNRLDKMAEVYWRAYFDGVPEGIGHPPVPDLNGFFIREDVPASFINNFINTGSGNKLIENELNSSYFPVDDGRIVDVVGSSFTDEIYQQGQAYGGLCSHFNDDHFGPTEESLDQVCNMMSGLTVAAKYIPEIVIAYDDAGNPIEFSDGKVLVKQEIKAIAERITAWIQVHGWNIVNPVTNSCVKGVFWDNDVGSDCKCFAGGSVFELFAFGLGMVNARIQTSIFPFLGNDVVAAGFVAANYGGDPIFNTSTLAWDNLPGLPTLENTPIGKEDYKVLTLAAAGHLWGVNTGAVLVERCAHEFFTSGSQKQTPGERLHLPLLHQALYGTLNPSYSEAFYECMLNNAPCINAHADDGNSIWSNSNGIVMYGYAGDIASTEISNDGYLYYFNLFNLVYPSYLSADYQYISPFNLCELDIIKTGALVQIATPTPMIESDRKHFIAANSITAQGADPTNPDIIQQKRYIIENDDDPQIPLYGTADITFEAKNVVNLHPGFEVHAGANFHATINKSLNPIGCVNPSSVDAHACEGLLPVFAGRGVASNDTNNLNTILSMFNPVPQKTALVFKRDSSFINISPNPSNGSFQITITKNNAPLSTKEIKIYDMLGNVIWENGPALNGVFNVNITSCAAGVYYVKYIDEFDKIEIKKIIKQ